MVTSCICSSACMYIFERSPPRVVLTTWSIWFTIRPSGHFHLSVCISLCLKMVPPYHTVVVEKEVHKRFTVVIDDSTTFSPHCPFSICIIRASLGIHISHDQEEPSTLLLVIDHTTPLSCHLQSHLLVHSIV